LIFRCSPADGTNAVAEKQDFGTPCRQLFNHAISLPERLKGARSLDRYEQTSIATFFAAREAGLARMQIADRLSDCLLVGVDRT